VYVLHLPYYFADRHILLIVTITYLSQCILNLFYHLKSHMPCELESDPKSAALVAETFPYVCVAFSGFHLNGITNQFIQTGQQFPSPSPSLAFERVHTNIMIPTHSYLQTFKPRRIEPKRVFWLSLTYQIRHCCKRLMAIYLPLDSRSNRTVEKILAASVRTTPFSNDSAG
jgi:hypothetical protein